MRLRSGSRFWASEIQISAPERRFLDLLESILGLWKSISGIWKLFFGQWKTNFGTVFRFKASGSRFLVVKLGNTKISLKTSFLSIREEVEFIEYMRSKASGTRSRFLVVKLGNTNISLKTRLLSTYTGRSWVYRVYVIAFWESILSFWESILGIWETIFGFLGVYFGPLKVIFGHLEVVFRPVTGDFRNCFSIKGLWESIFGGQVGKYKGFSKDKLIEYTGRSWFKASWSRFLVVKLGNTNISLKTSLLSIQEEVEFIEYMWKS